MSQVKKSSPARKPSPILKKSPLKVQAKVQKKKATPKKAAKPVKSTKDTKAKVKRVPKKESTAPKRPMTAFIIYMKENRENIKRNNPTATFTQIPVIGAAEWKALKPAAKAKYEAMSEKEKQRYATEMKTYVPDPEEKKKKRKKKDPNAPKRPSTAYIFYVVSRLDRVRKENPDMKMPEVMTKIGSEWKTLDAKTKRPFEDLAAKDKVRYANETAR